jgi:hypothetical protein
MLYLQDDGRRERALAEAAPQSGRYRRHRAEQKLAGLLHLYDRWINIIELCIAIYRHLDGKPFVEPSLRSRSPVEGLTRPI